MKLHLSITQAVLGVLLVAAPLEALAATPVVCPQVAAPAVSVRVVDPGLSISSTKSLAQINTMAGSHGLAKAGFKVLGMTEIKIDSGVSVRFQGQRNTSGLCVHVSKVDVRFGLKTHAVHVPREYARGSCQFNVVMRHEMAHVNVNRSTVRKYADILKNEMRSLLRRTGAVAVASMAEGQSAQTATIQSILDDVSVRFNGELDRLHAAIDAPGSKYEAGEQCRGW